MKSRSLPGPQGQTPFELEMEAPGTYERDHLRRDAHAVSGSRKIWPGGRLIPTCGIRSHVSSGVTAHRPSNACVAETNLCMTGPAGQNRARNSIPRRILNPRNSPEAQANSQSNINRIRALSPELCSLRVKTIQRDIPIVHTKMRVQRHPTRPGLLVWPTRRS